MDLLFTLPGRAPLTVKGWGNFPIELLACLAGVKPVIQVWVAEAEMPELESLCRELGLRHLIHARTRPVGVMVGRDAAALEEAAGAWDRPRANPGPQLGYPPCCADFYCAWNPGPTVTADIVRLIHAATTPRLGLPFLLNDAFYLYSRPWRAGDAEKRAAIARRNPGLDLGLMNVLPWHPCSYRCPESLRRARAVWELMGRVVPALPPLLKSCLARPVLFWDWDRFAVLTGSCPSEGECRYEALRPPFSLLDDASLALLRRGNRLELRGETATVFLDGRELGALPGPGPILLDFVPV